MDIKIINHPPRTRCYKCGAANIEAVCHHCYRAMCSLHTKKAVNSKGNLLSAEFLELGLKNVCSEAPIHCEFCYHTVYPRNVILIISVVIAIILGTLLYFFDNSTRSITAFVGIVVVCIGFYINKINTENLIKSRPPLPLVPHFNTVAVREILYGKIKLDSRGDYRVSALPVQGTLDIRAHFGKIEQDQLEQYHKKYNLSEVQNVKFSAGFAIPRCNSGIDFVNTQPGYDNTFLALTGMGIERFEVNGWHKSRRYNKTLTTNFLPIRIVPSLIQATARRALDLEIQWTGPYISTGQITAYKIDEFDLYVPFRWGQIQDAGGGMVEQRTLENSNLVHTIKWSNLLFTDAECKKHQRTFSISFEDAVEESDSIQGRLAVIFKGALSDIEGVNLFYPLGGRRDVEDVDISTKLIIDFELSLAGLRYQDIRLVPDINVKKDKDKLKPLTFDGLIPDHKTVIDLTNTLSESDYYIKRVIENPPRTGEQADRVNRYWDIAGRKYDRVYPIDFHLILSGETIKGEEFHTYSGVTKVNLTVRGAHANKEMEEKIEDSWESLRHIICDTLEQLSRKTPLVHQNKTKLSSFVHPEAVNLKPNADGHFERVTMLRGRLNDLFELLKIGRISETTFLKLKLEIEKELQLLQSGMQPSIGPEE